MIKAGMIAVKSLVADQGLATAYSLMRQQVTQNFLKDMTLASQAQANVGPYQKKRS